MGVRATAELGDSPEAFLFLFFYVEVMAST